MSASIPTSVKLVAEDEREFIVPEDVASTIPVIAELLNDIEEPENGMKTVNVTDVTGAILELVIQFVSINKGETQENEETGGGNAGADEWETNITSMEIRKVCELMNAAVGLEIDSLVPVCNKIIKGMIAGKTVAQIQAEYKFEFNDEEIEMFRAGGVS